MYKMGKGSSSSRAGSDFSSNLAAGAGVGVGASIGNAGGITICNAQNQNTWYCQFVQFFNVFKMLLSFLLIIGVIVFLFYWFAGSGRGGKMKGGGCGCGKPWP